MLMHRDDVDAPNMCGVPLIPYASVSFQLCRSPIHQTEQRCFQFVQGLLQTRSQLKLNVMIRLAFHVKHEVSTPDTKAAEGDNVDLVEWNARCRCL